MFDSILDLILLRFLIRRKRGLEGTLTSRPGWGISTLMGDEAWDDRNVIGASLVRMTTLPISNGLSKFDFGDSFFRPPNKGQRYGWLSLSSLEQLSVSIFICFESLKSRVFSYVRGRRFDALTYFIWPANFFNCNGLLFYASNAYCVWPRNESEFWTESVSLRLLASETIVCFKFLELMLT